MNPNDLFRVEVINLIGEMNSASKDIASKERVKPENIRLSNAVAALLASYAQKLNLALHVWEQSSLKG